MRRYLIRRLLWMLLVLAGVSIMTYGLTYLMPGDPARRIAGVGASADVVRSIRHQLGLDQPFWVQYTRYVGNALHGNFGYSYVQNVPVLPAILERFPVTAQLAIGGIVVELLLGLPTGSISAYKRGSPFDRLAMLFSLAGLSAPPFWLGLMLLFYLAFRSFPSAATAARPPGIWPCPPSRSAWAALPSTRAPSGRPSWTCSTNPTCAWRARKASPNG